MVGRGLIVAAVLLVSAYPVRGQLTCPASGADLVRAVTSAPGLSLTPEQQAVFDRLVAAVRAGNRTAQQQELSSLLRLRSGAAQPADACALVLRAVRLGKVDSDPRMVTALRPGRAGATSTTSATTTTSTGGATSTTSNASAYDSAVQTIASIQRQIWEDALKILANLKA